MSDEWELAGRVRRSFVDMVEPLDEGQWAMETLCPGWNTRHVLAHLLWFTELNVPAFIGAMATSRFNFERAAAKAADRISQRPRDQLMADLRSRANKKTSVPGAPETGSVADAAIHTQDVRRALGLAGTLDDDVVRTGLEFLSTHKNAKYVMDPTSMAGLQLSASDLDWSHGSGPLVEGSGEALLMSLTGRPATEELHGDGVQILVERLRRS